MIARKRLDNVKRVVHGGNRISFYDEHGREIYSVPTWRQTLRIWTAGLVYKNPKVAYGGDAVFDTPVSCIFKDYSGEQRRITCGDIDEEEIRIVPETKTKTKTGIPWYAQ